jgi:hypothetical protein
VTRGRSGTSKRILDAVTYRVPRLAGGRKEPIVFVELDTRQDPGYNVALEWDRDTGSTQIVVDDIRNTNQLVFLVPSAEAGDAFRHPFRYAP